MKYGFECDALVFIIYGIVFVDLVGSQASTRKMHP